MDRWAAMRFEMGGVPVIRRDDLRVEDDPEHDLDGPDPFAADSLDAAWAEAEAALPEGYVIESVSRERDWWGTDRGRFTVGATWTSMAGEQADGGDWPGIEGPSAATPAAALRALAAKLRERQP